MARNGKVVIRPDSGDPVDIICGTVIHTDSKKQYAPVAKGVVELLWDTFGGTVNSKGYKVLDPHIGAIYGDSINLERANQICHRLEQKGFASSNIVFGVGSFTYQHNTRDTYGFAMKATYGEVNGKGREIFKDPITDDGTKKSLKGMVAVHRNSETNQFEVKDQCSWGEQTLGSLITVFHNGYLTNKETFSQIKERLSNL